MIEGRFEGSDPIGDRPVGRMVQEERRRARTSRFARGTLACPSCDAPVAPARPLAPTEEIACPYCGTGGAVRDFLSLATPTRAAHVDVRIVTR
ncbi:MAG TPA: hypothetical protein VF715_11285 [Thermoleophilaceae bacterium]